MSSSFAKAWAIGLIMLAAASSAQGAARDNPATADGRVSGVVPFRQPAPLPAAQGPAAQSTTPPAAGESRHRDAGEPSRKGDVIGRKGSSPSRAATGSASPAAFVGLNC